MLGRSPMADLAAMLSRIAMFSIPPVTERSVEIERPLEAYAMDAATELGTTWLGLVRGDSAHMLDSGVATTTSSKRLPAALAPSETGT